MKPSYDDKMVITFNYKEGEETISLKEAEKSVENAKNGSNMDCSGERMKTVGNTSFQRFFHA